jgi:integrase
VFTSLGSLVRIQYRPPFKAHLDQVVIGLKAELTISQNSLWHTCGTRNAEECTLWRPATLSESKNGYSRTIPLTPKALQILTSVEPSSDQVFPTTANAVRLNWQRITQDAKIENLHFHDLRHEAISRFFERGLTLPEVSQMSGHRDARMLFRYAHADSGQLLLKLSK